MQVRAQRDLAAYFCCAMEVFTMTADFLKECGVMLPQTSITPFCLRWSMFHHVQLSPFSFFCDIFISLGKSSSLHNICGEIVPEVLQSASNKMFLEFLPSSLFSMRRMSQHLVPSTYIH